MCVMFALVCLCMLGQLWMAVHQSLIPAVMMDDEQTAVISGVGTNACVCMCINVCALCIVNVAPPVCVCIWRVCMFPMYV